MPVEKKKSLHHSRSDSDLIHPQVLKIHNLAKKLNGSFPWIRVSEQRNKFIACCCCSSSSSGIENKKNYVIVYSTSNKHPLIRVLVDDLILCHKPLTITPIKLPHRYDYTTRLVCTTSPSLGPRLYLFGGLCKEGPCKDVFWFDLHDPSSSHRCNNIAATITNVSLSIQVGECFYVLSFQCRKLVFQKYDLEKNEWVRLPFPDVGEFSKYPSWVISCIPFVPHIVIGRMLHVSLGGNSLAFDTESENVVGWEESKLFETFWSKSGLSPSDFYGGQVWSVYHQMPATVKPFGFYGRGILVGDTDKKIFIGIHSFSEECQLVAFLLDDMDRVVDSQPLSITDDVLEGVRLVDLGRDGYFGLIHLTVEPWNNFKIELVTIKVSRPVFPRDSYFLEYYVVRKDIVVDHLEQDEVWVADAFCV